jgi:iron complex transport system substrate-binding protein
VAVVAGVARAARTALVALAAIIAVAVVAGCVDQHPQAARAVSEATAIAAVAEARVAGAAGEADSRLSGAGAVGGEPADSAETAGAAESAGGDSPVRSVAPASGASPSDDPAHGAETAGGESGTPASAVAGGERGELAGEAFEGAKPADGSAPSGGADPARDVAPSGGASPARGAEPAYSSGSGAELADGAKPAGSPAPSGGAEPARDAAPANGVKPADSPAPSGGASLTRGAETAGAAESADGSPASAGYRLVATSRAAVEICDRLGLVLAGVPSLDGLPERYAGAARTGSAMAPDLEAIRLIAPTEVVGPDTLAGDLAPGYANAGIAATFLNLRGVGGLYESADYLGGKYGAKSEAARLRAGYEAALEELGQKRGGREGPRALILMGMPGAYVECTQHSYAGDLVALCGGVNVVGDPVEGFVSWNTEELLLLDPDVILRTAHALPDLVADMFEKEFSENDVWKHFRAVREGRVYDLDSEIFGMSANFRWPEAFERLSGIFYGEGG